jgi:hypothetical protein
MVNSDLSALDQLKKAVIDQKKAFLPFEADSPDLVGIHQAVVAYDQIVSQIVISALQNLPVDPLVESSTEEARQKIATQFDEPVVQNQRKFDFYRTYTARLDKMLDLAHQVIRTGGRTKETSDD